MAVSRFDNAFEQDGEPLQQGDHLFRVEHARRDEKLAGSRGSEGGVGLDERFEVGLTVRIVALIAVILVVAWVVVVGRV